MSGIPNFSSRLLRLAQRRQLWHEDPLLRTEPDDDLPSLCLDDLPDPELRVPHLLPRAVIRRNRPLGFASARQSTAPPPAPRSAGGDGASLEPLRDLREEARGHLVLPLAVRRAHAGVRERERLHRPRDAHVTQPPLLLQVLFVQRPRVRERPLLHPHHEDVAELQALGVVERHQRDPTLARELVRLRIQRLLLQKAIQSRLRFDALVLRGGVHELPQVLQTRLRLDRALRFELRPVARLVQNGLYELRRRHLPRSHPPPLEEVSYPRASFAGRAREPGLPRF